jgi:hypothetical protein
MATGDHLLVGGVRGRQHAPAPINGFSELAGESAAGYTSVERGRQLSRWNAAAESHSLIIV